VLDFQIQRIEYLRDMTVSDTVIFLAISLVTAIAAEPTNNKAAQHTDIKNGR